MDPSLFNSSSDPPDSHFISGDVQLFVDLATIIKIPQLALLSPAENLQGYQFYVNPYWVLRRSHLTETFAVYTGNPNHIVVVCVLNLVNDPEPPTHIPDYTEDVKLPHTNTTTTTSSNNTIQPPHQKSPFKKRNSRNLSKPVSQETISPILQLQQLQFQFQQDVEKGIETLDRIFSQFDEDNLQPRETCLGTIMIGNPSKFSRQTLPCLIVPSGDYEAARPTLILNLNLRQLGCVERTVLSFRPPSDATRAKFYQNYGIPDSFTFETSVIELSCAIQRALYILGLFPDDQLIDGLICDVTIAGLRQFISRFGIYDRDSTLILDSEICDQGLFSKLLDFVDDKRTKLANLGYATGVYPFLDPMPFCRQIKHFQKSVGVQCLTPGQLDSETILKIESTLKNKSQTVGGYSDALRNKVQNFAGLQIAQKVSEVVGLESKDVSNAPEPNKLYKVLKIILRGAQDDFVRKKRRDGGVNASGGGVGLFNMVGETLQLTSDNDTTDKSHSIRRKKNIVNEEERQDFSEDDVADRKPNIISELSSTPSRVIEGIKRSTSRIVKRGKKRISLKSTENTAASATTHYNSPSNESENDALGSDHNSNKNLAAPNTAVFYSSDDNYVPSSRHRGVSFDFGSFREEYEDVEEIDLKEHGGKEEQYSSDVDMLDLNLRVRSLSAPPQLNEVLNSSVSSTSTKPIGKKKIPTPTRELQQLVLTLQQKTASIKEKLASMRNLEETSAYETAELDGTDKMTIGSTESISEVVTSPTSPAPPLTATTPRAVTFNSGKMLLEPNSISNLIATQSQFYKTGRQIVHEFRQAQDGIQSGVGLLETRIQRCGYAVSVLEDKIGEAEEISEGVNMRIEKVESRVLDRMKKRVVVGEGVKSDKEDGEAEDSVSRDKGKEKVKEESVVIASTSTTINSTEGAKSQEWGWPWSSTTSTASSAAASSSSSYTQQQQKPKEKEVEKSKSTGSDQGWFWWWFPHPQP
ncbi:hypothetical protein HK098_005706 [Nowakowskiella sp. JEL0407]|nr:hypothetical protein HK098_005706 [Nowakowskiella sp. JEL0407]